MGLVRWGSANGWLLQPASQDPEMGHVFTACRGYTELVWVVKTRHAVNNRYLLQHKNQNLPLSTVVANGSSQRSEFTKTTSPFLKVDPSGTRATRCLSIVGLPP